MRIQLITKKREEYKARDLEVNHISLRLLCKLSKKQEEHQIDTHNPTSILSSINLVPKK